MRILDIDIQNLVSRMSQVELDRFWSSVFTETLSENINPFVDSSTIQNVLEKMGKIEAARSIDDDRAISEITDEGEKMVTQAKRAPSFPGKPKQPVRSIPREEIKKLIIRAQIMNSGKKYAEQFASMSREEIKSFRMYNKSVKLLDNTKYMVDPEYGVSTIEKHNILETLESQAYASELVAQIPEKKLKVVKSKFEQVRNNPSVNYDNTKHELEAMITEVFGAKADQSMLYSIATVDFATAFLAREKAIEQKSKNSLWFKLKNILSGRGKDKQKALPEGSSYHPDNECEAIKKQNSVKNNMYNKILNSANES